MGYVIAAIVVVLIVAGFVFFLVNNATRKSNVSDASDPGADQNPLGAIGCEPRHRIGAEHQDHRYPREYPHGRAGHYPARRSRIPGVGARP